MDDDGPWSDMGLHWGNSIKSLSNTGQKAEDRNWAASNCTTNLFYSLTEAKVSIFSGWNSNLHRQLTRSNLQLLSWTLILWLEMTTTFRSSGALFCSLGDHFGVCFLVHQFHIRETNVCAQISNKCLPLWFLRLCNGRWPKEMSSLFLR